MQVEFLPVRFVEDQIDFHEQDNQVFEGEELAQSWLACFEDSEGLQFADYALVDDANELHEEDDVNEMVFVGDGKRKGPADLLHEFRVFEERVDDR